MRISGRLLGPVAALGLGAAALGSAATMAPAAADSHPTTVVVGGQLGNTGLSREHVDTLGRDIADACTTLARKGGVHESERRQIVLDPGH